MSEQNAEVSWESQLLSSEKGRDGDTEFVYIKGLRRLAKIKGIKKERHPFINVAILKRHDNGVEYPFVQASYEVEFNDGSVFSDVADAHTYNLDGVFSAYPTAMAGNRAEARALRKALGISMVSKEELGADPEKVAAIKNEKTSAQIRVIKNLMKSKGVQNQMDVIKAVCSRKDVFDIEEFSFEEAKAAIKYLSNIKAE
jgi:hypothetical protein